MRKLLLTPLLIVAAGASLAACSDDPSTPAAAAHPAAPRFLSQPDLERQLGNGLTAGLERLAVMSQPPEGAADLGQDLPRGALDSVDCSAAATRPAARAVWPWRCTARWQTASGKARKTAYAVKLLPTGCFAAAADPPLQPVRDTTIASFSEHPLNAIVSLQRGC
jgi:hypothetical protein